MNQQERKQAQYEAVAQCRKKFRTIAVKMREIYEALPVSGETSVLRARLAMTAEEYLWFAYDLAELKYKSVPYDQHQTPEYMLELRMFQYRHKAKADYPLSDSQDIHRRYRAVYRIICREMEKIFGPIGDYRTYSERMWRLDHTQQGVAPR